jgi:ribosome biogenesis GTPase A
MSSLNEINWFPGHMAKARNAIEEKLKTCDGVIEIGDARAPISSFPDYLDKITQGKIRISSDTS